MDLMISTSNTKGYTVSLQSHHNKNQN